MRRLLTSRSSNSKRKPPSRLACHPALASAPAVRVLPISPTPFDAQRIHVRAVFLTRIASAEGKSATGIVAPAGRPDGEIPHSDHPAICFYEGDGLPNK